MFLINLTYSKLGDQMKKGICILLCFFLQLTQLHAEAYCVLSDSDNTVIEEKDMNKQQSVASISKIMTAVIALEHSELKDTWTCGKEISTAYGSMIYLKTGQQVSMKSLLYGLLLRSGNDAAIEIATRVAGNEPAFVKLMNEKAKKIGMLNTTFRNASGLDEKDGGNLSTAYDMALLMSYAMKNKNFREISGAQYYTSEWNYRWKNKNRLLFDYPFAIAGKTGFTKKAGRTLVSSAMNNGVESVVVTLGLSDDFAFHEQKHTEAFQKVQVVEVLKKGDYQVHGYQIHVPQDLKITMQKSAIKSLKVYTHRDEKEFIVEVQNGDNQSVYSYPCEK